MTDGILDDDLVQPRSRMSGKKLVLLIVLPLVLLLATAGGLYFSGIASKLLGAKSAADAPAEASVTAESHVKAAKPDKAVKGSNALFFDLPDMLVNLNTGNRKTNFLKISVSLELEKSDDGPRIQALMPRVVDTFQTYLRELRIEDLRGSAGLYRLREELLTRINAAVAPTKVDDVLFREMLVQ
jgi:flagellar FliL protein